MPALKRRLYQLILRLHPAAFRNRFAREMSLDFEDGLATYGFSRLLADATQSLLRQWATPIFSPSREQTPIPSHPLLAGHYMPLTDAPLTPFELLRGSMLFAAMLFALSLALKHGGNYIHTGGHNVGLAGGFGNTSGRASASNAVSHSPAPDYSRTLVVPTSSLPSRYSKSARNGHAIYVNPAAPDIQPKPESLKVFLARCAIVSAIVWIASFLMRRTRNLGVRVSFVAAGLLLLAFAAMVPLHLTDRSAQAAIPHPDNSQLHFKSATIYLRQGAPAATSGPAAFDLSSSPADLVHIDSPIRTLLADASNMPPDSIVGGPAWLDTDSYDITARMDPASFAAMQKMSFWRQRSQMRGIEQNLLLDRFHLKLHTETRPPAASTRATPPSASTSGQPTQVLVIDSIDRPSEN